MGLLIRRGTPIWTPANLGSKRFWADAVALGLSNNDPITTFTDQYGLDNFTGSGSTRPTFKTSILNGQPAAYFDGTDYMEMGATTDLNDVDGDFLWWCVFKHNTVSSALHAIFDKSNDASAAGTSFQFTNWNAYQAMYWQCAVGGSAIVLNNTSTEDTSWHYTLCTRSGSSWDMRTDGASVETATLAGSINDAAYKPRMGQLCNGTYGMTGYIGEMGMIAEYNAGDVTNLETYLTDKWGL